MKIKFVQLVTAGAGTASYPYFRLYALDDKGRIWMHISMISGKQTWELLEAPEEE